VAHCRGVVIERMSIIHFCLFLEIIDERLHVEYIIQLGGKERRNIGLTRGKNRLYAEGHLT